MQDVALMMIGLRFNLKNWPVFKKNSLSLSNSAPLWNETIKCERYNAEKGRLQKIYNQTSITLDCNYNDSFFFVASARGIEAGWIKRKDSSRRTNQQLGLLGGKGGINGKVWNNTGDSVQLCKVWKLRVRERRRRWRVKKKDRPDAKPLVVAI